MRLICPKIELHVQALGKAFWLALGRAPHNWVITTSLSTLSPQNTKLNEMNRSQSLWVKDVAVRSLTAWHWLTGERSGPGNCIQPSCSASTKCHLHSRCLQVRKKDNRHICLDRSSSRRENVVPDFLCEEYSPDLHLLYLHVLLGRRL